KSDLKGSCEGATHYVRAVTVGAFVVASGSQAELGANVKIMGKGANAGSASKTQINSEDGDVEACQKSTSDDKKAPDQCGALVRLELEPIGESVNAATPPAPELVVASCPAGFARADDGTCRKPNVPHQCTPGNADECLKQCEAGSAGSCATLAAMYRNGSGAAKDMAKAGTYGQKACDKDVSAGCRMAAAAKLEAKDAKGAIELLDKACKADGGAVCVDLGVAQLGSKDARSSVNAQYSFRRACYGGEGEGCAWLGTLYAEGKGGASASPKLAAAFYEKGCKDGSGRACEGLGGLLLTGKGVAKDAQRATELFAKACSAGLQTACNKK
ncbi:MAG TPA: tetratricopeptide repeat protein, partial [Kofleriaceae bacterium]|nr:tetratricopeptide repeat protein [Kofleriaceae bacterium]